MGIKRHYPSRGMWMSLRALVITIAVLLGMASPLSASAAADSGTMSLNQLDYQTTQQITITYTTSRPSSTNWVGIYADPGNGPVNGQQLGASTTWEYAPGSSGTVSIPASGLSVGAYVAYYLYNDGYTWLANPVKFRITNSAQARTGSMSLDRLDYPAGDPISVTYSTSRPSSLNWVGIYADPGNGPVNDQYVRPSTTWLYAPGSSGQISIPTAGLSPGHYVAYYLYNDGYSRVASPLKFRIVPSTAATTLKVASFNTWMAAGQVTDGPTKATNFITSSGADVVALQETGGTLAKDLARDLGWYYYQGPASAAIISRYAITQTFGLALDNAGLGARLNLGAGKQAVVWSVHLAAYPYGPYNACYEGMTPAQIEDNERNTSRRVVQINDILTRAAPEINAAKSGGPPVFLAGDFNAPSHLDWVPAAASQNCGYSSVNWRASRAVSDAGLNDSYRVVNPHPATMPGDTWSPVYPKNNGSTGPDEPQDRIDFVHYAGSATPVSSTAEVRGTPQPVPNNQNNEWVSDHRAVVTTFNLT
ncbi:endonuclease/exonuclease/phosphatase family protein [Streptomyces sp. NBC_00322]|uniref:endonuclease/exonuclease/phosphatase family protein n=1 Tax=Streptomyces sp. NBC_00322 TaxID=2975712 RepID=UPI002E2DA15D|nr:endonuclease/exonuclease/phosphatase family protein [Streptomyces sp. NBC_00322]